MPNRPISTEEQKAWDFAKEKHQGQIRKFIGLPYFDAHVQKVNGLVKFYTTEADLLIAALLHDVPEDCYDSKWDGYNDIKIKFSKRIADLVLELTSDDNEIKFKYDGDKAQYLIDKMLKMSDDALIIKLCDRLQNISDAFTTSDKFRNKYFQETSKIVDALENERELNKIHQQILADIKSKLANISSIFKIKKFDEL